MATQMDRSKRCIYCWCQLRWSTCDGIQFHWGFAPNPGCGDPHGGDVFYVPRGRRPILLGGCLNAP
jgi:hypothetical protein